MVKAAVLQSLKWMGALTIARESRWRQDRLMILCYHGIALEDEYRWNPGLFFDLPTFRRRLDLLKRGNYNVLPLAEGVHRVREGTLPPKSVVLTFDDGLYDFFYHAAPLLREYNFPATVYLSSYYSEYQAPVFHLACGYILWSLRHTTLSSWPEVGLLSDVRLAGVADRQEVVAILQSHALAQHLDGKAKDGLAAELAARLGFDYVGFKQKRILHMMTSEEVRAVASDGFDVQLHTHRHRTPRDRRLFLREITDNRERVETWTGRPATHFCYPIGDYASEFLPWLRSAGVETATTCDPALTKRTSDPLLLPRFVDTWQKPEVVFEGVISGAIFYGHDTWGRGLQKASIQAAQAAESTS